MSAAPFPSYPAIAVAAGAAALLALFRFLVRVRRDRLVADTPTARIRSAAQGYVKLTGRALPAGAAPTAAPLTSRPCVSWSYESAQEQKGKQERAGEGVARHHLAAPAVQGRPRAQAEYPRPQVAEGGA